MTDVLTAEQLLRLDRPAPRYTSYPTVPSWTDDVDSDAVAAAFASLVGPASVYVHVPFCREQCLFCGCNMVVSKRQSAADRYLDALQAQVAAVPLAHATIAVERLHLGGGTPTWLSVSQLRRLYEIVGSRFVLLDGAESSVELDPDVTTDAHLATLRAAGVNRLSIGVQSFDAQVLTAIHRPQDEGRIRGIAAECQRMGQRGLNLDLVYGLPHQTLQTLRNTVEGTLRIRPDRVALYGYAHVPWLKPHQRGIDADALPGTLERADLYLHARRWFEEAGYVAVGMDHFALPDDDLAVALRGGVLHRNFMGYTTRAGRGLVGLGVSAISELDGVYAQQEPHLGRWYASVESGRTLPWVKGTVLSDEDRLRRDVITALLCQLELRFAAVEAQHGVRFAHHFAEALRRLGPLQEEGLVDVTPTGIRVLPRGRLLVRRVAMAFDAYVKPSDQRFSRAV